MSEQIDLGLGRVGMSEWRKVSLSEVTTMIGDGLHGTPIYDSNGDYFFINGNNLKNGKIIIKSDTKKVSLEEAEIHKKPISEKTILLSINGTIGSLALFKNEKCVLGKSACFINIKDEVDKFFMYYLFCEQSFQEYLVITATGTTIQNVPLRGLRNYEFLLPPLPEQRAIAAVLTSLDDKIDLLHRQNKTLEAMAETLFRQWFVEGAGEDWEDGVLDNIVNVKGGTTPSTKEPEYWDGDIYWTSPRDLSNHTSIFMFDTERKITNTGLAQIGSGLMPVGTVLMSSRAPIGYLAITDISVAINQGYIAIVCDKLVSNYFMYLWCKANMEAIKNAGNGSTFEEISKSNFKALSIAIPPESILIKFDSTTRPFFEKIRKNQIQVKTLEKLRDNLLPKLMSGEVRVDCALR